MQHSSGGDRPRLTQSPRVATAVLVFGPDDPQPDMIAMLQFLLDDLRADGHEINKLWMGTCGAHLVFGDHDLILSLAEHPHLPCQWDGLMRPAAPSGAIRPDPLRARLARVLHGPLTTLGLTLRLPSDGADPPAQAMHPILLTLLETAQPVGLLWLPMGTLLAPEDVRGGQVDLLTQQGDPATRLVAASAKPRERPVDAVRPAHPRLIRPRPHTRAQRVARAAIGRLFGPPDGRNTTPLPRPDRAIARLNAALRSDDPFQLPSAPAARPARAYAVAAQWIVLVPHLIHALLPYA